MPPTRHRDVLSGCKAALQEGFRKGRRDAPVVHVHQRLVAHEQRAHELQCRDLQREVERLRARARVGLRLGRVTCAAGRPAPSGCMPRSRPAPGPCCWTPASQHSRGTARSLRASRAERTCLHAAALPAAALYHYMPRSPTARGRRRPARAPTVISATGPNGHRCPELVCPAWSPATLKDRAVKRTCALPVAALDPAKGRKGPGHAEQGHDARHLLIADAVSASGAFASIRS